MKKKVLLPSVALLLFTSAVCFISCKRDKISTDTGLKLDFSVDTLAFDTVFTSVGSSTRIFKIYNPNSSRVNVSTIKLGGGVASFFRLNVNGKPGIDFKDIEIAANDSIWVFAEVTVNPSVVSNPFIVLDSIVCITNGNAQQVWLSAYGQNAIFHRPVLGNSTFFLNCNEVWDKNLPHVVYGTAVVDTNCSLEITKGTKVYFYDNGALQVSKGASLKVTGTQAEPVFFEGSRLESWYEDLAGQWEGVFLDEESIDHEINYLNIKNARIGLFSQAIKNVNPVAVSIKNTTILNCSREGLFLRATSSKVLNTVISNCGENAVLIENGGSHELVHCTISNELAATNPENSNEAVLIKNWSYNEDGSLQQFNLSQCSFVNSIIYGSTSTALDLSDNGLQFNYSFKNCLLKTDAAIATSSNNFVDCIFNELPKFENASKSDLQLAEGSPAIDVADLGSVTSNLVDLEFDLQQNSRVIDGKPDVGAYELVK